MLHTRFRASVGHSKCLTEHRPSSVLSRCRASTHLDNSHLDSSPQKQSEDLLNSFWLARGVTDASQRQKLIATASVEADPENSFRSNAEVLGDLPGAGTAWLLNSKDTVQQVREVSERVLKLHSLFGDGVDIAAMVIREPRLVRVDMAVIAQRLLELRLCGGSEGLDVMSIIQSQPSLLVQDTSVYDNQAESDEARRRAWEFGLVSDGDREWQRRADELREYRARHGDAHVGFRENDDPELARWAAKQRKDWKTRDLSPDRQLVLERVDFEFEADKAEWMRWYTELQQSTGDSMLGTGSSSDFYLYNWCCVQRIAQRSGVLSEERRLLLDAIGFDWTGADALS